MFIQTKTDESKRLICSLDESELCMGNIYAICISDWLKTAA